MSVEERVERVESAIVAIKDLLVNHDERLDGLFLSIKESRKDFDFKWNAVIDAQLRNETAIAELRSSIGELRLSVGELKDSTVDLRDASESQLRRIEILKNK